MLEKWKLSTDNKVFAGGVLMDLSKALDLINHQTSNRKQRIKINNVFSSWKNLILGLLKDQSLDL